MNLADTADGGRNGLHVLLVEDEPDSALSMKMLLETQDHRVRWMRDGAAALADAGVNPPDLILLDIGLPGIDGYEVARRLKALHLDKDPLVIVTTGRGYSPDTERLREIGIDLYLIKPVDPRALLAILERFRRVLA